MIIGIGGKLKHGKDSIANILIDKFDYKRISLADPLKKILHIGLNQYFELDDFYNQDIKDLPFDKYTSFPEIVLNKVQIERIVCAINLNYNLSSAEMDIIREWFKDEKFYSLRDLMQRFGTNLCRNLISSDIWVKICQKQVSHTMLNNPDTKLVTADIRFIQERQMIRNLNGLLILVKRNLPDLNGGHISEQSLGTDSDYDVVIENTTTLEDLETKVINIYQQRYSSK